MKKWGLRRLLSPSAVNNYSWNREFLHYMVVSALSCPVKLWISRLLMTSWFMIKFIPETIKEWIIITKILKREIWVPDYCNNVGILRTANKSY